MLLEGEVQPRANTPSDDAYDVLVPGNGRQQNDGLDDIHFTC